MKLYKVLKALDGHKPGETIELDPTNFATKHFLTDGSLEEALGVEDELMVQALDNVAASIGKSIEAATKGALERIDKAVSRGPRIDAGDSPEDKQKSFGHQLCQIAALADAELPVDQREKAQNVNTKLYRSAWNSWDSKGGSGFVGKAALAEGAGVQGGYTVFPEFSSELLRIAIEDTALASRARKIPMGAAEVHIPALDQTTALSAGQTSYTGGMIAYWAAEAATRTEVEPKFKQVILRANELTGYSLMSRTLLHDNGIGLEAVLGDLIRETVAWYTDYACLQGTGNTQPLGILNAPASVSTTRASSNLFKLADASSMLGNLLPRSRRKAVWIIAPDVFQQLLQLVDTSGRVVFLPNLPSGDRGSAQVMPDNNLVLFGLPVVVTEKLPALGTTGDVILVDPTYYLLGERLSVEVAVSEHYKFINNQMTWRFVARLDGQPWMDKALTLQDGARKLSPYVYLHS